MLVRAKIRNNTRSSAQSFMLLISKLEKNQSQNKKKLRSQFYATKPKCMLNPAVNAHSNFPVPCWGAPIEGTPV